MQQGRVTRGRVRRWLSVGGLVLTTVAGGVLPAQSRPVVYVVPIEGMIDLGLAPFVQRVLDEAAADSAAAVILDINTLGGRLDAALKIRDALLGSPVQTVAFIDPRAISAGALIALATHRIAITSGGTIGAATPVQAGAPGAPAAPVEEKTVSYVRKEFRATAESRGRPPQIAEAMVDADVVVPGLVEAGKLLTLTTDEALEYRVADFRAATMSDVLQQLELANAEVRHASVNWAEQLVRLLTHPVLSSLLLSVGILGILIELRTPGFGVPGALGIISLALVLGGHWLVELAGWEELLLIVAGLVLLGVEMFVLPGFGIAGILGIAALLGGLSLSLVGAGAAPAAIAGAVMRVLLSMVLATVGALVLLRFLPRVPAARGLILQSHLGTSAGYVSAPESDTRWLGKAGRTLTVLRPAGIAEIDGERVDVVSDGEMIEAGAAVVVARVDGNRIVVRRQRTSTAETGR